ncbi:MAG: hypothetical protein methR_P0646 [Methyloprofundus sp.]|nr:MAG: hypothetical protein methR_P0646 [Methyloprofundus sp.]
MRGVIFVVFLGFVGPVSAITKCELNGKVIYKAGTCPKNASTKFLVKGNYVAEQSLRQHEQLRAKESDGAFEQLNTATMQNKLRAEQQMRDIAVQRKSAAVEVSDESAHFQLRKVEGSADKLNNVARPAVINDQFLEMEEKIKEHERALQQLQGQ